MRPSGITKRSRKSRSGSTQSRATLSSRDVTEADDIGRTSQSKPSDTSDHGARDLKSKFFNKPSISLFLKRRQLLVCGRARAFLLRIRTEIPIDSKSLSF